MYAALWRVLPGPWWLRVLILLMAVIAVGAALVTWVFPWVDSVIVPPEATVDL